MLRSFISKANTQQLDRISDHQARRFGDVLRKVSGEAMASTCGAIETRGRGGRNLPRLLYLTREPTPLNALIRLFLLGVAVTDEQARAALEPVPLEEWTAAGLVEAQAGEVRACIRILPVEGLPLAMDLPELLEQGAGSDFVSGITNSTAVLMSALTGQPSRAALDIGTGCGILALLASRHSECVWATDINPRALSFARLNAKLNGISNIRFALGGGFQPVEGRRFDVVITNPPFILGPVQRYTFRDSGMELDGLCRQLALEAPGYLEPGGLFLCELEWPVIRGQDWKERLSAWFQGSGCDALVLRTETGEALNQTEGILAETEQDDPEIQARLFAEYASYFEAREVESVSGGLIVLRRRDSAANWIQFEDARPPKHENFGDAILGIVAAHDAVDDLADTDLLEKRFRVADGLVIETGRQWTAGGWSAVNYRLRQPDGLCLQAGLDAAIAGLVQRCDGTTSAKELIRAVATGLKVNPENIIHGCVAMLRTMTQRGFLLPE